MLLASVFLFSVLFGVLSFVFSVFVFGLGVAVAAADDWFVFFGCVWGGAVRAAAALDGRNALRALHARLIKENPFSCCSCELALRVASLTIPLSRCINCFPASEKFSSIPPLVWLRYSLVWLCNL